VLLTGVIRRPRYNATTSSAALSDEIAVLALGGTPPTYDNFMDMEFDPHGNAHVETGGYTALACIGWLCDVFISVRDPMFFLLHNNVDRLWAKWQWQQSRFDHTSTNTYTPQTPPATPGSDCARQRSHVGGALWPWSGVTSPTDPCRPSQTVGGAFVVTLASPTSPPAQPAPRDVIDYRFSLNSPYGNGFAYDDVPHQ
jgi:tyrosinase